MTIRLADLAERSPLPLYGQVAVLMRTRIERSEWSVGAQIPTVDELAREYGVARITVRQALDELAGQGLISRGRGRGTLVARSLSDERWYRLPTTWKELLRSGEGLGRKLLESAAASHGPVRGRRRAGRAVLPAHTARACPRRHAVLPD